MVSTLESLAASKAVRISAFVWSAVALASIPSSFVPSVATSRPSTVPVTAILPDMLAPELVVAILGLGEPALLSYRVTAPPESAWT